MTAKKQAMAYKVIERVFVVVYGTADPTDEEWLEYVESVKCSRIAATRHLICTDGGGPSWGQRWALGQLVDGHPVPVALVSPSGWVRLRVAVMSLFCPEIRAFPPSGLRDALDHLRIPGRQREIVERELQKLRAELGGGAR